jgi:hypothetical protein
VHVTVDQLPIRYAIAASEGVHRVDITSVMDKIKMDQGEDGPAPRRPGGSNILRETEVPAQSLTRYTSRTIQAFDELAEACG